MRRPNPLLLSLPQRTERPDVPLYIDPVRGLRAWRHARQEDGRVLLYPLVMHSESPWPVGEWITAQRHVSGFGDDHAAPGRLCNCGIHAIASKDALLRQYGFSIHTLGEVELAGRVIVHSGGWRAERARISAIFVWDRPVLDERRREQVCRDAEATAATYRVPLVRLAS